MFIGHFAIALGAKKLAPNTSLGTTFMACQLLDLIWPVLVLLGIESVRVDYSATQVTPLDFIHYPFSHSLGMTLFWSILAGGVLWYISKSLRNSIILALVVASHWILDLIVHRPDLPLWFGSSKYGWGLWNIPIVAVLLELLLFCGGLALYLKTVPAMTTKAKIIFWSLITFLGAAYASVIWGPKPPLDASPAMIAGPALAMWLVVAWAYWADRRDARRR